MFRLATVLLLATWLLPAAEPASALASTPHMILAHYMPCAPNLGLNPSNDYWYAARLNPKGDNQIAWPILTAREGKDHVFEAYIDDIRLAKQYGILSAKLRGHYQYYGQLQDAGSGL
jgi:hypothetical protein